MLLPFFFHPDFTLSVLEFHQFSAQMRWRTVTAGREFHPALKNLFVLFTIPHKPAVVKFCKICYTYVDSGTVGTVGTVGFVSSVTGIRKLLTAPLAAVLVTSPPII